MRIKETLHSLTEPEPSAATRDGKGVKLPKLDVPTFNGNILNWRSFWEQFSVSVHSRTALSDAEKLVYLRHAVKDGSAKHTTMQKLYSVCKQDMTDSSTRPTSE